MVQSYLGFEQANQFGVIASNSNVVWLPPGSADSDTSAGKAVVGGLERVLVWDIKTGIQRSNWTDDEIKTEVTCLSKFGTDLIAAGYSDGTIRLWDARTGSIIVSFNGHRGSVSCLSFDASGTRLASGSSDSNVIVWDLVGEVGLYRLRSHRDRVTAVAFLGDASEWLITTSKDGFIKLWDLETQHCLETHLASHGECWAFDLSPDKTQALTSGADRVVKLWKIDLDADDGSKLSQYGTLDRESRNLDRKDRAVTVQFHPTGKFTLFHGAGRLLEVWRRRSDAEMKKAIARRKRRRKSQNKTENDENTSEDKDAVKIGDLEFVYHTSFTLPSRIRSATWISKGASHRDTVELLVSLAANSIETYTINASNQAPDETEDGKAESSEPSLQYSVDIPGHRTDVRALSLSSDDSLLASASEGSLKVWNVKTGSCLRTFKCGYALCTSFLPGDDFIVVGTKSGELELFDVASSTMVDSFKAHGEHPVYSFKISPDGSFLVSGGADKHLRFWEIRGRETRKGNTLKMLKNTKALKVNDEILSVSLSPDGKYVATSLLDNTIKVFFVDTLKFYISLYGHKLPVLSMDISYDSKLLVSCSADKNIKIWGLDFGDCHRSIFAHQDSIMAVKFDKKDHTFFSASKDKLIKSWDGDKFENIQKFDSHHGAVWDIAVASSGTFFVSASHDKSIRVWEQTEEQIFLEEVRERELEELYESNLAESLEQVEEPLTEDGQQADEVTTAGKQTVETLMAGERIIEALDMGMEDLQLMSQYAIDKKRNPKIVPSGRNVVYVVQDNISAERHLLNVIEKIKPAALQDALLVLPFEAVPKMFTFINIWCSRGWNLPLVCRILFSIIQIHHKQIVATKIMREILEDVRTSLRSALQLVKNDIGFNIAGLEFIQRNWDIYHKKEFIDENEQRLEQERSLKKRAFMNIE